MTMPRTIVGTKAHKFVGDHNLCAGILEISSGTPCLNTKENKIHQLPEGWHSWECGPKPSTFESQVGGGHYKDFAIQPLEFIVKNGLDFLQGNVVKYVVRYKVKGGLEDLKKARHYLDMMIELMEKNE
jgi:hypothetical protein